MSPKAPHPDRPGKSRVADVLVLGAVLLLVTSPKAHAAYIDPGAGSFALQVLLGSLFGVGFFFRRSVGRIMGLFSGKKKGEQESPEQDES